MKQLGLGLLVVMIFSHCQRYKDGSHSSTEASILVDTVVIRPKEFQVVSTDPLLKNINSFWLYNKDTLSGYIVELDGDKVVSKIPVIKGKEHGWALGWYADGKKKFKRFYCRGKREYHHIGWYNNGALGFDLFFSDDKYEGVQRSYHSNGKLKQEISYRKGYEEGLQKIWNEQGRLVTNFTIKNGKLYGVVGRFDCVSVMAK
jgi:antitoxin component YwqK of YwqJK toxin-antitoxin module